MSDARHQRFEIDIDEIERQLRRSVEATPNPKPDPLAELARIVGQDDPFRGILGGGRSASAQPARPDAAVSAEPAAAAAPSFGDELAASQGARRAEPAHRSDDLFLDDEDLQPLQPRRSRSRLVAVVIGVALTLAAVGGFLVWRNPGAGFRLAGTGNPPVVTADQSPLKVAPDKPGGIEVPNQDRQIYDRAAPDGRSRVVDSREQPVDVREAVRNLPPSSQVPMSPPGTVQDGTTAAAPGPNLQPGPTGTPLTAPPARAAVANALGEPRRVRTVAVRPDGTTYTPPSGSGSASMAAMPNSVVPGAGLPAPVPVTTTTIPIAPPNVAPAQAPVAAAPPVDAGGAPSGPAVSVLPPQRPKGIGRGADAGDTAAPAAAPAAAPVRVASAEAAQPTVAAPARGGTFAVQLAVRPSEQEARSAYSQLLDRFSGDLEGKPATVTEAQVNGKTVHRIRVGPMSKDAANVLCTKLKASGGQCFVAGT